MQGAMIKIKYMIKRNHHNKITIIVDVKEGHQIDTRMTDTIISEKGVVEILTRT